MNTTTYVIYKYLIPIDSEFSINIPGFIKVLKVGLQHGEPVMWVLRSLEPPREEKINFMLLFTGEHHKQTGDYVDTFQLEVSEDPRTHIKSYVVYHLFMGAKQ